MKIAPWNRVVCICRKGQVRSVAARNILINLHGFNKVLACGWENNDAETITMLCRWADVIIVVGNTIEWPDVPGSMFESRTIRLNIGRDMWGAYDHPLLLAALTPLIAELVDAQ